MSDANIQISRERRASGILVFVIADLVVFGLLFVGFLDERRKNIELFNASSATLDSTLGMLNTLILVTSGFFMVLAVNAARQNNTKKTQRLLLATLLIGLLFGINKVFEYQAKLEADITMMTNSFYMFYYALTGAHCLHFIGGVIALLYLLWANRLPQKGHFNEVIQPTGFYWHMVDLLWIFIYPLLYLLR